MKKSTAKKKTDPDVAANEPTKRKAKSFTVPETYREIVRKNERQGEMVCDVLVCGHAVEVDADTRANTFRKARSCFACRTAVQRIVDADDLENKGWYGVRRK